MTLLRSAGSTLRFPPRWWEDWPDDVETKYDENEDETTAKDAGANDGGTDVDDVIGGVYADEGRNEVKRVNREIAAETDDPASWACLIRLGVTEFCVAESFGEAGSR